MEDLSKFMTAAIEEAEILLREGNCGFGAEIVKDGEIIVQSHDTEKTEHDPTAHAELVSGWEDRHVASGFFFGAVAHCESGS